MRYRLESSSRRFGEHDQNIAIEIRWRPAHKGVPGNEKADEWAKLAAGNPDLTLRRGMESNTQTGTTGGQCPSSDPLRISGGRSRKGNVWKPRCGRIRESTGKEYQYRPAGEGKRLAARFYQLKTSHCLTGLVPQVGEGQAHSQMLVVPVPDPGLGASLQVLPALEAPAEEPVG